METVTMNRLHRTERALANVASAIAILIFSVVFVLVQVIGARADDETHSLADLAERLSPAVVNITTSTEITHLEQPSWPRAPSGSPLEKLFPEFFGPQGDRPNQQRRGSALGSGFIISADGYIVTNNHVIVDADKIQIELFDGGPLLDAEVVGTDDKTDIALLKVESDTLLPFVEFGDSDTSRVGDRVLAIGNPFGHGFSVSSGIISAHNRSLRGAYDDFIQTDAAINKGNSGGPLFNMHGEVIGVNTAIVSMSGGSIGLGFSMSSNVVSSVIDQLSEFGETRRGWLGVQIQNVDESIADAVGLDAAKGALVNGVPEGPAKSAGIQNGDIILNFNQSEIADIRGLIQAVGKAGVGKTVQVEVFRDGKTHVIDVVLARREDEERNLVKPAAARSSETSAGIMGMRLSELTEDVRSELRLEENIEGVVVVSVAEASEASEKGIRSGDLISEVGQKQVGSVEDVAKALEAAKDSGRKSVLMLVHRGDSPRFVALAIEG